jgi:hypothetical protein
MSKLFVDDIVEKTSGHGVHIPGHVVQVKHAIYGTQTDISSGGYIDSGVTATITPHSTSSKILVIAAMQFRLAGSTNIDSGISFQIMRGSTAIFTPATAYRTYVYDGADDSEFRGTDTFSHEDSPSSTSALTYKIQGIKYAGTTVRMQDSGNQSSMILMEIAQ